MTRNLRQHYVGCYRLTLLDSAKFAQILRAAKRPDGTYQPQTDGREWLVEIRQVETGALERYAGVFPSLKAAVADLGAPKYMEGRPHG